MRGLLGQAHGQNFHPIFFVDLLTVPTRFAPKADANSNSAKRKLEQKRIFSLQNLVETKTCCTFAIANGTGSGKTEI